MPKISCIIRVLLFSNQVILGILTSLCFNFPICKMDIITIPTSEDYCKD